jgi:hypothetical protein
MLRPAKIIKFMKEKTRIAHISHYDFIRTDFINFIKPRIVHRREWIFKEEKKTTTKITLNYYILRISVSDNALCQTFRSLLIKCIATCKQIWDSRNLSTPYIFHFVNIFLDTALKYMFFK